MPTTLEDAASPAFPRDQYLLSPRSGSVRTSSWVDGRQRALMFFWENPTTRRVAMIRTQAPYITELLQRFFGTTVDGRFGELTRAAIVRYARSHGVNFPENTQALGPLLAYALQVALLGSGRVAFPPSVDFPNTNQPVLATNPENRRYSTIYAMDLDSGQEVPFAPLPQGGVAVVPTPPPVIKPTQPAQPEQPAQPNNVVAPQGQGQGQQPGSSLGIFAPDTTTVTQNATSSSSSNILSGNTLNFQGLPSNLFGAPAAPAFEGNPFIQPLPADGTCPKGYTPMGDGTCMLTAMIRVEGRFLIPNAAYLPVEYGKPETYPLVFPFLQKEDKTKEKV